MCEDIMFSHESSPGISLVFYNKCNYFKVIHVIFSVIVDDSTIAVRTRSLDSLEPDDEEEREIPIVKKKKHRSFEESSEPGKKSDKLKKRQHVVKDSSEGESVVTENNQDNNY